MIQHQITPSAPMAPHSCGHAPHLIEARGRSITDPRLFGKPARMFHVECGRCGVATTPSLHVAVAEGMWAFQVHLVPVAQLPALRVTAERQMATAA